MDCRPALSPFDDSHPVPEPVRTLISGIVTAVRAGDDAAIRTLLERLAPVADTTALLLLRYRLGLEEESDDPVTPAPGAEVRRHTEGGVPAPSATPSCL
ncbi:hypothetical protein ACFXDP_18680 [Streptomyces sp. NPDC059374]|uniref:hypothetical protein n=1 Tax=Streptomyces TaxID=1883 RepID=UPI0031E2E414